MKKSYMFRLIMIFCFFCSIISCSKEEQIELEVSASEVEVLNPKATFTVTSNAKWTLSKQGNYNFRVYPTFGDPGTTEVSIDYVANNTDIDRKSVISIKAGNIIKTVTVVQSVANISFAAESLAFDAAGGTKSMAVTSNTEWDVRGNVTPEWVKSVKATVSSGNGEIVVEVNPNTDRSGDKVWEMQVNYAASLKKMLKIVQEPAPNAVPSKPVILTPANNATGISVIPDFTWEASTDADGDELSYTVMVSKNGTEWSEFAAGNATKLTHSGIFEPLEPNTTYYYKVKADDSYNNGTAISDVYTFTTSEKDAYTDGEYVCYQKSEKESPILVVFTGDGYLAEHHRYGGLFDTDMNTSIEGLFEVEPYKTYREYFTVYKLAAYSNQTGVTNNKTGVVADTKFGCEWSGGNSTYLSSRAKAAGIYEWCDKIPEFKETSRKNTAVAVIINADVYAGTCTMWDNGQSIALMTYNRNAGSVQTTFVNTVKHELGGHGIGRLADEYTTSSGFYPEDSKPGLRSWQKKGTYLNVTVEPLIEDSPWAHFVGVDGYSHVGMFEGAAGYKQGVWRPEQKSCMISNWPYFNSPSRFYIVKRILETAGEVTATVIDEPEAVRASKIAKLMELFVPKDVQKTDNTTAPISSNTYGGWDGVPYDFRPLAPPVLIETNE